MIKTHFFWILFFDVQKLYLTVPNLRVLSNGQIRYNQHFLINPYTLAERVFIKTNDIYGINKIYIILSVLSMQ